MSQVYNLVSAFCILFWGRLDNMLRCMHNNTDDTTCTASQISSFRPSDIRDYKPAFSTRNRSSSSPQHHLSSSRAIDALPSLFPVESLRIPHSLFVKAVQERLINDICSVPGHDRRLCRLNGGFLIFPQRPRSDWGTGWEHHAQNRYASCLLNCSSIIDTPVDH